MDFFVNIQCAGGLRFVCLKGCVGGIIGGIY